MFATLAGRTPEGSATTLAEEESGAWLMFAELATQDASAPSWQFLDAQWSSLSSTDSNDKPHAPQLLRVISMAAAGFPADRAAALCAQLRHELDSLTLPHGVAAAHIAALAQLTATHGGDMPAWTSATLSSCEAVLFKYIDDARHGLSPDSGSAAATSGLFVTGEVALLKAAKPTQRLVTLVQALTSPALALEAALSSFSQPMPPSESNERGQLTSGSASVAPVVQAHAWVTLGKLCLADEALAKKCVPLFVQVSLHIISISAIDLK